jgi:hypothetical protein
MSTAIITFDGAILFDKGEHTVEPLSWRREAVQRGFAGLDGVVSMDLGRRERKLRQRGQLVSASKASLLQLMELVASYIDGQAYDLIDQDGVFYAQVRMDSFTLRGPITAANQARCEYEIIYTQLSI